MIKENLVPSQYPDSEELMGHQEGVESLDEKNKVANLSESVKMVLGKVRNFRMYEDRFKEMDEKGVVSREFASDVICTILASREGTYDIEFAKILISELDYNEPSVKEFFLNELLRRKIVKEREFEVFEIIGLDPTKENKEENEGSELLPELIGLVIKQQRDMDDLRGWNKIFKINEDEYKKALDKVLEKNKKLDSAVIEELSNLFSRG